VLFVDSLKQGVRHHIEPYEKGSASAGSTVLYNVMACPGLKDPLSRIKAVANLKSGEKRFLQEGHIRIRLKVEDAAAPGLPRSVRATL
jgi:hypothetical protein